MTSPGHECILVWLEPLVVLSCHDDEALGVLGALCLSLRTDRVHGSRTVLVMYSFTSAAVVTVRSLFIVRTLKSTDARCLFLSACCTTDRRRKAKNTGQMESQRDVPDGHKQNVSRRGSPERQVLDPNAWPFESRSAGDHWQYSLATRLGKCKTPADCSWSTPRCFNHR